MADTWACPICTAFNDSLDSLCQVCYTGTKPTTGSGVVADDLKPLIVRFGNIRQSLQDNSMKYSVRERRGARAGT